MAVGEDEIGVRRSRGCNNGGSTERDGGWKRRPCVIKERDGG